MKNIPFPLPRRSSRWANIVFLPSLTNEMIRMSKEEEMGKKKKGTMYWKGVGVKVNLNRTPRIPD